MKHLVVLIVLLTCSVSDAAVSRSRNFVVTAPTQEFADLASKAAETYRHEMAILWTGKPLPGNWPNPCPIKCKVGRIGAGGATSFTFSEGEVFGWHMEIQGSEQRILDSVLPHEISHMIFACHFRCPLPRWADEGAATLVEHESERMRQTELLKQVINTSQKIPIPQLLTMQEYPQDMQQVLVLYAEGYSLSRFLVQHRGKQAFLGFVRDGMDQGWDTALNTHYAFKNVSEMEETWTSWRRHGRSRPQYSCQQGTVCPPCGPLPSGSVFVYPSVPQPLPVLPPPSQQPPVNPILLPTVPPVQPTLRTVVADVWIEKNVLFVKYTDGKVEEGGRIEIPPQAPNETMEFTVVFEKGDEEHEKARSVTINNGGTLVIPPQMIRVRNVDKDGNPAVDDNGTPVPPAFDVAPLDMPLKIKFETPLSVSGTTVDGETDGATVDVD